VGTVTLPGLLTGVGLGASPGVMQSSSVHVLLVEWFPGCPAGMSHLSRFWLCAQHVLISMISPY